ncbi:MAG: sulfite exporter TauE/SafE family protein [Kiritimatiellaceae bacterium]|nr:sulfite exporter TauE/SafE family protein [Kiritimatiellaceae bacterium]
MEQWYLYIIAGLAAGILSSMFGVGSGILMIPILTIAFAFGQKSAQGMALALMVPMALVGALRYYFNPEVEMNLKLLGLLAVGGVVGAVIGSQIVFGISDAVLKRMFAVFIIITGIHMFMKSYSNPADKSSHGQTVEDSSDKTG